MLWIEYAWFEVRPALRSLRRSPGSSLAAIIVLTLGIGACTAVFAIIDAVLVRPLPFATGDRLVWMWSTDRLWQRRFGADTGIVDNEITLSGQRDIVAGVMPPRFRFPVAGNPVDLWIVLRDDQQLTFIAFVACWIPARKAARVDPLAALRCQ